MGLGMRCRAIGSSGYRCVVFGIVASGFLFGANETALASAGCTAFNGSFNGGVMSGNVSGTGFSAGDVLSITVVAVGGVDALGLFDITNNNSLLIAGNTVGTRTYSVPANTAAELRISGTQLNAGSNFTWSCVAGTAGQTGATDSQKLDGVQNQGSSTAANTSGINISGSVGAATDAALNQPAASSASRVLAVGEFVESYMMFRIASGGSRDDISLYVQQALNIYTERTIQGFVPIAAGAPMYVQWRHESEVSRFAPERTSSVKQRTDEAFAALGYAAVNKAPSRMPPVSVGPWTPWFDVRGTGFDQSGSGTLKGTQINALAGLNYRVNRNLVVGVFGGYENFNYEFAALSGKIKGDGGTVGVNAGWAITPTLRWKGMIAWTGVSYDATAATAAGSFSGSRWMASTGLTGSYRVSTYIVEPSVDVLALRERQTAYTDNLGAAHASRSFSSGRVAVGGRVLAPVVGVMYGFTPYAGLYGDWRFATDTAQPAGVPYTGIGDGWSARVTAGLSMPVWSRGSLSFGGELGGLGANYKTWTGNARLSVPF